MSERPVRYCDVCKQYDDHPRHVVYVNSTVPQHIHHSDCGAELGCEECSEREVAFGRRRGQELIDHLNEVRG